MAVAVPRVGWENRMSQPSRGCVSGIRDSVATVCTGGLGQLSVALHPYSKLCCCRHLLKERLHCLTVVRPQRRMWAEELVACGGVLATPFVIERVWKRIQHAEKPHGDFEISYGFDA